MSHRSEILRVRLTPAELVEVERRATEAGLEVADWVRRELLGDRVEQDGRALRWLRAEEVRAAIVEERLTPETDPCPVPGHEAAWEASRATRQLGRGARRTLGDQREENETGVDVEPTYAPPRKP